MKTQLNFAVILLLVAIFSSNSTTLNAQVADTLALPEIIVDARKFDVDASRISSFLTSYNFDLQKTNLPHSVGDILKSNSRFLLRSYGPGQAQTAGTIGFTPTQVKVMWNGMDLNHPMLGLTDLSLIPVVLLDEITVDNHLGSSEYGANAMGGVINLESGQSSNESTSAGLSVGSFENRTFHVATSQRIKNWFIKGGIVLTDQLNDFEFKDGNGNTVNRANSDKNQITGLFSAGYQGDRYWNNTSVWVGSGESGSPGSKTFPSADARQTDKSLRGIHTSNWMHNRYATSQVSVSFNQFQLDYVDPAFSVNSSSKSTMSNLSYSIKNIWSEQLQLRGRVSYEMGSIESNDYELSSIQHGSVQLNGLFGPTPWMYLYPSIRYDNYSEFSDAWSYGAGLNIEAIDEKMYFIANLNKNYAPPTFNDLYWPMFGNPDLVPESSVKFDVGTKYLSSFADFRLSYFNTKVEDGIIWWVDESGSYRPSNVNRIMSDGITAEVKHSSHFDQLLIEIGAGYTYLNSTYSSRDGSDLVSGNTVVYTPANKFNASFELDYLKSGMRIDYQFIDKRFTYDSNSAWLDPYHLIDAEMYQSVKLNRVDVNFLLGIQNVFDVEYEQIMDYPMPGRYFNATISIRF
ncbi:MAG TPA: hypothetical protein DCE78_06750 [Bacteroidetes bacterium]|nr:hypothetical protein [Bacteroidota bacterium]